VNEERESDEKINEKRTNEMRNERSKDTKNSLENIIRKEKM